MKEKYNILDEEMSNFFIEIFKVIDDGYFDVVYDWWSFVGLLFFIGIVVIIIGKYKFFIFLLLCVRCFNVCWLFCV